jgi:hypothetical protein
MANGQEKKKKGFSDLPSRDKFGSVGGSLLKAQTLFSTGGSSESFNFGTKLFSKTRRPISEGFEAAALARDVGGPFTTILGSDPEHVFAEKRRLSRAIEAKPLAGAAVFGEGIPFFGGQQGSFSGALETMKELIAKSKSGTLSDTEKEFLQKQARFGSREGTFRRLVGRRASVVRAREEAEAARRRSPGRTQTILTRREG